MAVKKDKTLEDFTKIPNGVEELLQKRVIDKDNAGFRASQPVLFIVAILLGISMLGVFYFTSSASTVKSVSILGNTFLDRSYLLSLSGINLDSKYYLTFPNVVAKKIAKDPMVSSVTVDLEPSNVISIQVIEQQPVGYRYEEDTAYILMKDGSKTELTSDYMRFVSRIPYIVGFTDEKQTHLLTKGLSELNQDMIEEIAQINQYQLQYDSEALQIQMRDGTYLFTSYYDMSILNQYHEIYSNIKDHSQCLFADTSGSVAVARACPWNETETVLDYWLDADGNPVTNKYGDPAVKHYYTDANGEAYLDENGYPILIQIDEFGVEQKDENFLENYEAGYYSQGYLVYPEQTEEDTQDEEMTDGQQTTG